MIIYCKDLFLLCSSLLINNKDWVYRVFIWFLYFILNFVKDAQKLLSGILQYLL